MGVNEPEEVPRRLNGCRDDDEEDDFVGGAMEEEPMEPLDPPERVSTTRPPSTGDVPGVPVPVPPPTAPTPRDLRFVGYPISALVVIGECNTSCPEEGLVLE